MNTAAPLPPQTEADHLAKIAAERQILVESTKVRSTTAASVATTCLKIAYTTARHQNDRQIVSAGWMTEITSALLSAGNVLSAIDKIDPAGKPPDGFTKRTEFTADGRLVIVFEQVADVSLVPEEPPTLSFPAPEPPSLWRRFLNLFR